MGATEPPILYITNSETLQKRTNKEAKWIGEEVKEYTPNFRYATAVTKPYKGTRKNPKPFHFYNLIAYMQAEYEVVISEDGLEADDMMCIKQANHKKREAGVETVICSRDKDLRICPGWHFSWECGKQRSVGPHLTDVIGSLGVGHSGKTLGYGLKMFYYQMLVGDSADNIPGCPKVGDKGALKLLEGVNSELELFKIVQREYIARVGKEKAKKFFMEQASLLWMVQRKGQGYEIPRR